MFDTFMDKNRRRISQCKAFDNMLDIYYIDDEVKLSSLMVEIGKYKENIIIDALLPFQFIRISLKRRGGNRVVGVFEGIEDTNNLSLDFFQSEKILYLDYYGDVREMSESRYTDIEGMNRLWEYIINYVHLSKNDIDKMPVLYKHSYNDGHMCSRCSDRRVKESYDYWDSLEKQRKQNMEKEENYLEEFKKKPKQKGGYLL